MNSSKKYMGMAVSFVLAVSVGQAEDVRYHITFDTPDQGLNQLVRTGPAPDYVSFVPFGQPLVVSSFGALTDQPLLFTSNQQLPLGMGYFYTQIGLSLPQMSAPFLDLSFDFFDIGANHFFTLLFDTPSVRNIRFDQNYIYFDHPFKPPQPIGTYRSGVAYRFNVHLDLILNRWRLSANGSSLAEGILDAEDYVRSIRFNYSAAYADVSGTAIDNVVVAVPEPHALALGGLVFLGLNRWCRMHQGRRGLSTKPFQL